MKAFLYQASSEKVRKTFSSGYSITDRKDETEDDQNDPFQKRYFK
jgi:hypothetical protein